MPDRLQRPRSHSARLGNILQIFQPSRGVTRRSAHAQSPRGDSEPPDETFGPFGTAERLNWLVSKETLHEYGEPALDRGEIIGDLLTVARCWVASRRAQHRPMRGATGTRLCSAESRSA